MNKAWYNTFGPDGSIAVSSRVRLARNIAGHAFPNKLNKAECQEILNLCKKATKDNCSFLPLRETPELEKHILVERRLISLDMLDNSKPRGIFLENDETACVLINEEDHIRIQAIESGLNLGSAYKKAAEWEKTLAQTLDFAYSNKFGYLTACPTNIGTGLRASVMLHLPALAESRQIEQLFAAVRRMGITVRGVFGEGSDPVGNFYQVSNQTTLGISEEAIIFKLSEIISRIINQEREIRTEIYKTDMEKLDDIVWRSYGILKNARLLTSEELLKHLSNIRLGADLEILGVEGSKLNKLNVVALPYHITKMAGADASGRVRDRVRAEIVRQML